jgi:hypothetical protein
MEGLEHREDHEGMVLQPVHEYSVSLDDAAAPLSTFTHLGTDFGPIGPGEGRISWARAGAVGHVCVEPAFGGWAGMWHSLAGLAAEKAVNLDLAKCYPFVRPEYQPGCVGATLRVQGSGLFKLELTSPEGRILWWATREVVGGERWEDLEFTWADAGLRRVKYLNWSAEPGASLLVDSLRLVIRMPEVSFGQKVFLVSYAKLARSFSPDTGLVKSDVHLPAGVRDSTTGSGLFCLATCAAWRAGFVKRAQAEQIVRKVHAAVGALPRACGLLPRYAGEPVEYTTLGTSLYYHSMLLAAQMLWDGKVLAGLVRAVREIDFDRLRDGDGHVVQGLEEDGCTPLAASWRDWGGEAVLVLLLEYMATGCMAHRGLRNPGTVPGGVGLSAEIQSLFYPEFSLAEPDAVTGIDWLRVRRALLQEQKDYFPRQWPGSAAARLGLYGLSTGQGPRGAGQVTSGTRTTDKADLIHPHYVLMSGLVEPEPATVYRVLRTMESHGLLPPWGMVENFTKDLDYLPTFAALSAGFECISAYHLWAKESGAPDHIYAAAAECGLLREAVRIFYPLVRRW